MTFSSKNCVPAIEHIFFNVDCSCELERYLFSLACFNETSEEHFFWIHFFCKLDGLCKTLTFSSKKHVPMIDHDLSNTDCSCELERHLFSSTCVMKHLKSAPSEFIFSWTIWHAWNLNFFIKKSCAVNWAWFFKDRLLMWIRQVIVFINQLNETSESHSFLTWFFCKLDGLLKIMAFSSKNHVPTIEHDFLSIDYSCELENSLCSLACLMKHLKITPSEFGSLTN